MGRNISKLRQELGEDAWKERQRLRNKEKNLKYRQKPNGIVNTRKITERRRRIKEELIQYKGGKCCVCGYDKPIPPAYDFHHIDPESKDFSISGWKSIDIERLKREVDKCILVCRNCHAEIHFRRETNLVEVLV